MIAEKNTEAGAGGLTAKTIAEIRKVFAKYPQIKRAVLYGSRAKGTYRNGSDIDLTLEGENLTLNLLFNIETDLDDLLLPYKIDLSVIHKIQNSDLLKHIEKVGVVFYDKSKNEAADLPNCLIPKSQ